MPAVRLPLLLAAALAPVWVQGAAAQPPAESPGVRLDLGFEVKAHLRESSRTRWASPFPFPPEALPPDAEMGWLETVSPGTHLELSVLSVHARAVWSESLEARARIDVVDLHNRNPTTTGRQIHLAEAWLRIGRESLPALVPGEPGYYLKIGKFGRFDRQLDRHLESYGLVGTALNRFADVGLEVGADLGERFYLKAAVTQGNPVFLRDPNALAGDLPGRALLGLDGPDPATEMGFPVLYNAQVQDLDFGGDLQVAGALGFRTGDAGARNVVDVMAWGNRRKLADRVDIDGSLLGGDLALFRGPRAAFPLDFTDDRKEEIGLNVWLYLGPFSAFAQVFDQDLGGMSREGYEIEVAYAFTLPLRRAVAGQQLFQWITPAVRFSRLEPDIGGDPQFPAPSIRWDWEKIDVGARLGILDGMDLTVEYAFHRLVTAMGGISHDELLATMRWRP